VGVVNQTVQDAIGDGGIADLLVPARDRQLGSKDGGTGLVAIFADLPDFAALVFIQLLGNLSPLFRGQLVRSRVSRVLDPGLLLSDQALHELGSSFL
jgi:hypothetical protein